MHPRGWIWIPDMPPLRDGPERRPDELPAALVIERPLHRVGDEAAALPGSYPTVELLHEPRIEANVHTHAHSLAQCGIVENGRYA